MQYFTGIVRTTRKACRMWTFRPIVATQPWITNHFTIRCFCFFSCLVSRTCIIDLLFHDMNINHRRLNDAVIVHHCCIIVRNNNKRIIIVIHCCCIVVRQRSRFSIQERTWFIGSSTINFSIAASLFRKTTGTTFTFDFTKRNVCKGIQILCTSFCNFFLRCNNFCTGFQTITNFILCTKIIVCMRTTSRFSIKTTESSLTCRSARRSSLQCR
mmetsp:Transcript_12274/g.18003  ORF Transcript_12274/g.18003 Transcript_12274/m.18003 type:complete len:213 (-) Transcript_12274:1040-1678(-)